MDEEGKQMQLMRRQRANQNGSTVRGLFPTAGVSEWRKVERSEDQLCAGTAVARLVSPLEAFDGEKTERWKKITPGETLQRRLALKVHLSPFLCLCTC